MSNDTVEGGIISKKMGKIFHGIKKITYEVEEQDWAKILPWGTPALTRRVNERIL